MTKPFDAKAAADAALERRLDRLGLSGQEDSWADRYLLCNDLLGAKSAEPRQKFEATSRFIAT